MNYKEEYIKMRNEKRYDLNFFYNYYLSEGGKLTDPNQFTEAFIYNLVKQTVMVHPAQPPQEFWVKAGERDKNEILAYMDRKFGVTILEDKDKQFIKVVC